MDGPKPTVLPTVTITGKRVDPKKYRTVKEKVKLYPRGEVDKSTVDSLRKAGRGDLIGKPLQIPGQMDTYSAAQGDIIKRLARK